MAIRVQQLRSVPDEDTFGSYAVLAVGLTVVFVIAGLAGDAGVGPTTCVVLVLAAVGAASWWLRPRVALVLALVSFLFVDGFGLGSEGQLTWDGTPDLARLCLLLVVAALSSGLSTWLEQRRLRAREHGDRAELDATRRLWEHENLHRP